MSLMMGIFMLIIFGTYAYCFYMGSIWKYKEMWNHAFDRPYSAGDIVSCFFGVVFGMFSIAMAGSNVKAVGEGKIAGKMAFDVIERIPQIPIDDPEALKSDIKGNIEFKDVTFVYPSRPEQKVL
eukprot:CAMPEP_0170559030 /NCGR_PEP_ID=MMETSP0211-20121228/39734_1 /TAXON_ID=311385 /ORGANISM="Pseudokeronopsis sp., Strain OXSARD2" /LENGTH=123 /DNA_ID=CAMNT_0010871613 /DNA_START=742 /DNA_END=1113 /DNA_ORIENTATION=+